MSFTVQLRTHSAPFHSPADEGDDYLPGHEVARILREIASSVETWDGYDKFQTVFNVHGQEVGRFKLDAT